MIRLVKNGSTTTNVGFICFRFFFSNLYVYWFILSFSFAVVRLRPFIFYSRHTLCLSSSLSLRLIFPKLNYVTHQITSIEFFIFTRMFLVFSRTSILACLRLVQTLLGKCWRRTRSKIFFLMFLFLHSSKQPQLIRSLVLLFFLTLL
jgi:hypothetical protein